MKIKELRNRDFVRRCVELYAVMSRSGQSPDVRTVVKSVIYSGAGGYYISYDHVARKVVRILVKPRDQRCVPGEKAHQMRLRHIAEAVEKRLTEHPLMTFSDALRDELNRGHAPRFYFSVEHGVRIFYAYTRVIKTFVPDDRLMMRCAQ